MPLNNRNTKLPYFLKNISVDFGQFYSQKRRLSVHILFWLCLLAVYTANLKIINTGFTLSIAFVLAFRQIVQSVFLFYFIAYLVIPKLFLRGRYLAGIVTIFLPFLFAPTINYLSFKLFYPLLLRDKIAEDYINLGLFVKDSNSIFNSQEIILSFMPTLLRTLPAFIMKLLVSTIHFFSNTIRQKKKQHQLEMENLHLEVNFLKSQMNPHYLFNTLNNIYSYTYLKDDRALGLLSDLSEVLSYTLYESKETFVSLDKELIFLEHYVNLEKAQMKDDGSRLVAHIDRQGADDLKIAALLLFPFVENAIKHGIECDKKSGWLKLHISVRDGRLSFMLKNSKPKYDTFKVAADGKIIGGVGIATSKRRLDLLYPSKHDIRIENTKNTYAVYLTIKCLSNEPNPELHYS